MSHSNSLSLTNSLLANQDLMPVPTVLEVGCRFPLNPDHSDVQAEVVAWFKLERQAGPLTQGTILRAAILPAGERLQLLPVDARARFVLEDDCASVFHCGTVLAEAHYWQSLRRNLVQCATRETVSTADDSVHIDGQAISYSAIVSTLEAWVERIGAVSQQSETAARASRSEPGAHPGRLTPQILTNSHPHRAQKLFFYRADKYEVVRLGLHRIDRLVAAATENNVAAIHAEIDQQLQQLGLLDANGQVNATARHQFSWQHVFIVPTPHILIKTCMADGNLLESGTFKPIRIDPRFRPGQTA